MTDERTSILAELTELLRSAFALEQWGRLLVELVRDDTGVPRVADVQVEEVVDEEQVDRAFQSNEAHALVPALAKAVEALVMLDDADLDDVRGGTFVRRGEGVTFLPGLVRTPSVSFDRARDEVEAWMFRGAGELAETHGIGAGSSVEADTEEGTFEIMRGGVPCGQGEVVVLGSFERAHRAWVWGGFNPSLSEAARKRGKALLDAMTDRTAWEISTPGFVTDDATAMALAAWVAKERGLYAITRVDVEDGFVVLGLVKKIEPVALA